MPLFQDRGAATHLLGLGTNIGLAVVKLTVGVAAGSQALIADGLNSLGDVVATSIAWVGYQGGKRPADDEHPFGHGNIETAAGFAVGCILLMTGLMVTVDGLQALAAGAPTPPQRFAAIVAVVTAIIKELLYRVTHAAGSSLNSPSLLASARDHRADVVLALTVLAGILGAQLGWPWLDPAAAALVGLWVMAMSWEPLRTNMGVLLAETPAGMAQAVEAATLELPEVQAVDRVRVQPMGSYNIVDMEIRIDGALNVVAAHRIAHAAEAQVLAQVPHISEVLVHVNPGSSPPAS